MVLEVGIISWLIYFLLDNKSLSVFTESSTRQNLSLASKAKLHSSITGTINNSKKLNSIIARALDEISEEINLTNNLASIIIDDSILSHSIIIKSKKYDNIDQQIREESQLKWGDKTSNYYFISEEKKTPKNVFHSVAIHHFLREKIKLNFSCFFKILIIFKNSKSSSTVFSSIQWISSSTNIIGFLDIDCHNDFQHAHVWSVFLIDLAWRGEWYAC